MPFFQQHENSANENVLKFNNKWFSSNIIRLEFLCFLVWYWQKLIVPVCSCRFQLATLNAPEYLRSIYIKLILLLTYLYLSFFFFFLRVVVIARNLLHFPIFHHKNELLYVSLISDHKKILLDRHTAISSYPGTIKVNFNIIAVQSEIDLKIFSQKYCPRNILYSQHVC